MRANALLVQLFESCGSQRRGKPVRRAKNATLVLCLFVLYGVLLSQGLRAGAGAAFFGALAAVPLTIHIYRRIWPLTALEREGGDLISKSSVVGRGPNLSRQRVCDLTT